MQRASTRTLHRIHIGPDARLDVVTMRKLLAAARELHHTRIPTAQLHVPPPICAGLLLRLQQVCRCGGMPPVGSALHQRHLLQRGQVWQVRRQEGGRVRPLCLHALGRSSQGQHVVLWRAEGDWHDSARPIFDVSYIHASILHCYIATPPLPRLQVVDPLQRLTPLTLTLLHCATSTEAPGPSGASSWVTPGGARGHPRSRRSLSPAPAASHLLPTAATGATRLGGVMIWMSPCAV